MEPKKLHIGLALAMGWLSGKGWQKTNSGVEKAFSAEPYIEMAKLAEQHKLDFIFRPDTQFLNEELFDKEPGFCNLDPMLLLAAIAEKTNFIGLISTASTTLLPPYYVAKQLQTLHWLSQGRAGWNIVTAIDGHQNYGEKKRLSSAERYEKSTEFLEVVKGLWGSFPNKALTLERTTEIFADKALVQPIHHEGKYFSVKGPLNLPASPFGEIPLFQAGASEAGRGFAASVADAVFSAAPDIESALELRDDIRARAKAKNRNENSVKLFPGLSLFLADTKEQAIQLYKDTHRQPSEEKRIQYIKDTIGIDFSNYSLDQPIDITDINLSGLTIRSQTHSQLLATYITREKPTLAELLERPEVIGSSHWLVIGTPEDAYKAIVERASAKSLDGFIAIPGGNEESMMLFFNEVIPLLVKNDWFRKEYKGKTLKQHLAND
ncbi:NtaA/DmoA family FMN-dependent monooxygenase [Marinomonas sp.]|nr:NtaA/DmoA family FMN-dependent monooxygenase [Marinomonas sp.]MDB4836949.1 NtaA/DmoA family FMN-dependent monooxygenase [Marinomonas sp.]